MMSEPPRIPGRRFLHSPGPSPVPDEVLHAMSRQPMDLADPRVMATIGACEAGVQRVLGTAAAEVFFYISNGHGAWEAVVENLLPPGGTALVPGTGHFSDGWAEQTEALGRRVQRTAWREGHGMDLAAVGDALRADTARDIVAVFAVHTDTASGVTNDLVALRQAMDASGHPALLVVDAVASLGVEPLHMDSLRANVVLGASQKGLMCPPGLALVAVDAAALAVSQANPAPRYYWDWERRRGPMSYHKFCGTPPLSLLAGLEASLALIFTEGLPQVWARHALLAHAVHAAVEGWREGGALDFACADPAQRSAAVTAITVAPGIDVDALRTSARERFQVAMAGGLGPYFGRAFRIGHLGDQNAPGILGALAGIEATLRAHGVPVGQGGVQRAVEVLSRGLTNTAPGGDA
jgi:alanine-glyoxylate transaminase / serine-glyoxylate transaminase / serine-pyruvate transaminase